jgi:hypothetical protein
VPPAGASHGRSRLGGGRRLPRDIAEVRLDNAPPRRDSTAAHGRSQPLSTETDSHSIEPDIFDGDLTPSDLVYMLENLNFGHANRVLCTIRIDRQVRDYLVRAIAPGRR